MIWGVMADLSIPKIRSTEKTGFFEPGFFYYFYLHFSHAGQAGVLCPSMDIYPNLPVM
jgi:hypothetical protein